MNKVRGSSISNKASFSKVEHQIPFNTSSGRPMAVDREFVDIVFGAIRSNLPEKLNLKGTFSKRPLLRSGYFTFKLIHDSCFEILM